MLQNANTFSILSIYLIKNFYKVVRNVLETGEIKTLYTEYASQNISMPKEYYKISKLIELLKKEISDSFFGEAEKQTFEKLCQNYIDMSSIDCEQCFIYGFSLGTRLSAESFINAKGNTKN